LHESTSEAPAGDARGVGYGGSVAEHVVERFIQSIWR
jgi:hypothetical protein